MKRLSLRIAFLVLGSVMAVDRVGYAQLASPPGISKAFGAATIPVNGTTSLSFVIVNPNIVSLTGVGFTDNLPAGLVVATPIGLINNSCGGTATATAGSSTISLSGGTMGPGFVLCDVKVNVTGTTAGVKNNTTSAVTSSNGTGNTSTASLTVVAPPTISKAFNPATIALNGTTSLTFTITNPNATVALAGVAFSDTLFTGLTVASSVATVCSGTLTTTAPTGIALSGASIAAASQCQFSVTVTGAALANYTNTTGAVSSTNGGTGTTSNVASLDVLAPTNTPTITPTNTPTSTLTSTATNTPTSTPTGTPTPVPVVPTLNESGMLIFGLLIAAAGLLLLVRRR